MQDQFVQDEFFIRLVVTGETLVPEAIIQATGLVPTEIWHTGDVRHKAGPRRRKDILHQENGWELHSPLPKENPLDDHTEWILQRVQPFIEGLKPFVQANYCELSCAIYYRKGLPVIHFNQLLLQMLGELGAELDVDLYDLREVK